MNLVVMPNQSKIERLCKSRYNFKYNEPSFHLMHSKIEDALLDWVNEMHAREVFFSGETVKEKGIKLLEDENAKLPNEKEFICISPTCLGTFKSRLGLRSLKSHREMGQQKKPSLECCLFSRHICAIFLSGTF